MTAPVLDDLDRGVQDTRDMRDMPLEQVPPVNRELPPLRSPGRRPPVVAAALAVVGALLAGLVAAATPEAPLVWTLASGALSADGAPLDADATAPVDTPLVAGSEGAVLRAQGARVELDPDTGIELRSGVGPVAQTVVLRRGRLVADVEVTLSVDATVVTVTGFGGAFRVERDDAPRVATYDAAVGITGDTAVSMTRLRQVPLGGPQSAVGPIILDPEDPWDARYAEGALAIDAQVENLAGGLRATYGTGPQRAAFYRDFVGVTEGLVEALPQLAPSDLGDRFGPPAETLIAAAVVTALVEGTGRALDEVVASTLVARAAGGTWGVILAQDDLDAAYLREVTDDALRRRAEQGEDAEPVLPATPTPSAPVTPTPEPEPSPTPQPTSPPSPQPEPAPPSEPSPEPSPSPDPGPLEDPVGTIEDLLDPDDGVGGTLEDLGDVVDDLLEPLPLLGGFVDLVGVLGWR